MYLEILETAIHSMKKVKVILNSKEKGRIERICIPFDFGPSRKYKDKKSRFHFYDLDSPEGKHNLSILPSQIINIEILKDSFSPEDYVKWQPNWFIVRNWGKYS
ncbi:hypothetical protein [Psychrilyobacter atlanticus]|uniref:hypothetical protein n=1 Tax=Psychrilyobacter atlanticus TaxID=271091 RepID=UPI000420FE9A|nr:hypothetical protein [Psychrilyobacter atlanticus]